MEGHVDYPVVLLVPFGMDIVGLNWSKYACVLGLRRWNELDLRTCVQDLGCSFQKAFLFLRHQ
jgi:hypothetical protein